MPLLEPCLFTMAGSIAVMINAIIRDLPGQFIEGYDPSSIPVISQIIGINGFVWNGTIAVAGLIFAFSFGFNLARAYGVNDLAGGIVSLAALIQGIAFSLSCSCTSRTGRIKQKSLRCISKCWFSHWRNNCDRSSN